ncbi:GntR family transcriptional regulator, partial [Actinoplanes philippinensis]|uniref:GntR family transcriptional regulator n=1 Tax=Actinoplanes philippinensis TaxID=35752 RepID=UPI0033F667DF
MEASPLIGPDTMPLYLRLADRIEEDLRQGDGSDGARLPSERQLADRYEASRVTIRAALGELRERGIVVSLPARGWAIAAAPKNRGAGTDGRVLGFTDLAQQRGLTMHSRVLSTEVRPATVRDASGKAADTEPRTDAAGSAR